MTNHYKPLPEELAELEIDAHIDEEAFALIRQGYAGSRTTDKWALIFQGESILKIYRTATGSCIFEVTFAPIDGGVTITRAVVNRRPDQYRGQDPVYDARLLIYLIRKLLLKHSVPFPMPADLPQRNKAAHERHVMGSQEDTPPSFIPLN